MTDDERIERIRKNAVGLLIRRGAGIAVCVTLDAEGTPEFTAEFPEGHITDVCAMLEAVRANLIHNIPPHSPEGVVVAGSSTKH